MARLTSEQVLEVCSQYKQGVPTTVLASAFNVSVPAIVGLLKRRGISRRSRSECQRKYTCNHDFFGSITTESQAYWLGFLSADAAITPPNALVVTLGLKDRCHLDLFLQHLKSTHPVGFPKSIAHKACRVFIRSERLCQDLAFWGVVPNKTHTMTMPPLDDELVRHFIRGYVDGDGGFHLDVNGRITFEVTGTFSIVLAFQEWMIQSLGLAKTKLDQRRKESPFYTLRYCGRKNMQVIYPWLYDGASVCLERKRQIVSSYLHS